MANMRIPGILQRIAWSYCVVAMMKMWLPVYTTNGFVRQGSWTDTAQNTSALFSHYALHWAVAFTFFAIYLVIMLFVTVPTWEYNIPGHVDDDNPPDCVVSWHNATQKQQQVCTSDWVPEVVIRTECDVHGDLTPKCSATRMVDVWLLGYHHMWQDSFIDDSPWCVPADAGGDLKPGEEPPTWCKSPLDPEGVLSSIPTVLTTWLGLHYGLVLTHFSNVRYRLKHWAVLSTVLFALGWVISPFWAMNKQLWSPAYLFFMAGSCGYLLIALYLVYDFSWHSAIEATAHQLPPPPPPPYWQRISRAIFMPCVICLPCH